MPYYPVKIVIDQGNMSIPRILVHYVIFLTDLLPITMVIVPLVIQLLHGVISILTRRKMEQQIASRVMRIKRLLTIIQVSVPHVIKLKPGIS